MSRSTDEGDQKEEEPHSRMWAEPEPGPSRCESSGRGYCGYCRVLYTNLDQHLSSLSHLDSVRTSSRGSALISGSNQNRLTLLERFLQDVQEHHPHRYGDARPSHADLASVSAPLLPKVELDDVCSSEVDGQSAGTREHLPSCDDASPQLANQETDYSFHSQSEERTGHIKQDEGGLIPACPKAPPPQHQAPPSVHKKAHRKTNRRKPSESSSSTPAPRDPSLQDQLDPSTCQRPQVPAEPLAPSGPGPPVPKEPRFPSSPRPFLSWQRERREIQKAEAFSLNSDPVEQTIEEVIQMCCYGLPPPHHQQEDVESLHLSLPVTMETQSEDWDTPVQVVFQAAGPPTDVPVQVSQKEGRDLGRLMDVQVDIKDQVYSYQLDSALLGAGAKLDHGFCSLPIEEVLPVPEHIPESFRGKTWTQIEQEDDERVDRLVQQFRLGRFICYFDTESLARYGRRRKEVTKTQVAGRQTGVLTLVDRDEDDSACMRVRKRRRGFRLASRCQVVKVSHGTQTLRLVIPTVHQPPLEAPPTSLPAANERTPEAQPCHSLPPSYSSIVTPVQPHTSLVYLLCSPTCAVSAPNGGSAPKRCRRRRRPVDLQQLKVKYKRLPLKLYDPGTNQILKNPPQGLLRPRGPALSGVPPPCVRQLFRSLSPDLNTDRRHGEGPNGDAVMLSALSGDSSTETVRRRGRIPKAPPRTAYRTQRESGGRPHLSAPQRRTRIKVPPPQSRREGLRPAASNRKALISSGHALQPPRRGRSQRGRGHERRGR